MKTKTIADIPLEYIVGVRVCSKCGHSKGTIVSISNRRSRLNKNKNYIVTIEWDDKKNN